ncbi:MAG TPA: alpha/beta fold hydrolase [Pseudolabrys sp.]|nr:alpha/beta fold hydrolase [Pseudolabrys sp.]
MARLDTNIEVTREGKGPALVLLHCLGVDRHFWDFAAPLGSDFTVIRYDLPGHGTSAVPGSAYSIDDLADQLAAILKAQNFERASVAGISLGGLIAQNFAARYPKLVDRLILVDTTPRYTDEMRGMWAERAATARGKGVAVMVDALLKIWFSAQALIEDLPGVRYVRDTLRRASGEGYALACEALAAADLRDLVPTIKARTLVICGDDDIPSFLDAARWLSGNIKGAELLWIGGTRHASVLEKPQHAAETMKAFLTKA